MTILVAVKKNGRVYLGADRITTFGNEYTTELLNGTKIIKLKHAYLATSGYTLMDNVIEHLHSVNHRMMENTFKNRSEVFQFFLELYAELKKAYTLVDTGKDTYAGIYNIFFVVTPSSIYGIANNMSVHEYPQYATKGAGSDYSLGSLYATYDTINDGYELVRTALEAACHFSLYCREPLDIIEVKPEDFGKPVKGYKDHSKAMRTLQKRRTPGNLLEVLSGSKLETENGRQKEVVAAGKLKTVATRAASKNASKAASKSASKSDSRSGSKAESRSGTKAAARSTAKPTKPGKASAKANSAAPKFKSETAARKKSGAKKKSARR